MFSNVAHAYASRVPADESTSSGPFYTALGHPSGSLPGIAPGDIATQVAVPVPVSLLRVAVDDAGHYAFWLEAPARDSLVPTEMFIVDAPSRIYVWVGLEVSDKLRREAMHIVDTWQHSNPIEAPELKKGISRLNEGSEPPSFWVTLNT